MAGDDVVGMGAVEGDSEEKAEEETKTEEDENDSVGDVRLAILLRASGGGTAFVSYSYKEDTPEYVAASELLKAKRSGGEPDVEGAKKRLEAMRAEEELETPFSYPPARQKQIETLTAFDGKDSSGRPAKLAIAYALFPVTDKDEALMRSNVRDAAEQFAYSHKVSVPDTIDIVEELGELMDPAAGLETMAFYAFHRDLAECDCLLVGQDGAAYFISDTGQARKIDVDEGGFAICGGRQTECGRLVESLKQGYRLEMPAEEAAALAAAGLKGVFGERFDYLKFQAISIGPDGVREYAPK